MVRDSLTYYLPMMDDEEVEFILRYLSSDDTLLEYGSGNSTLFFSVFVNKVISIEHDKYWYDILNSVKLENIEMHFIPNVINDGSLCRYLEFKDYVNYPIDNKLKFNRVLIDGRARKYCAKQLFQYIDEDVIVFIHDFNRPDYRKVLKYYDIIDMRTKGRGIVALRKKSDAIYSYEYF